MNELIQFQNVTLGYRRKVVLANLNFSIFKGEFFGIVGANGSGKTTILRALLGILKPLAGQIVADVAPGEAGSLMAEGGRVDLSSMAGAVRFGYVPQRDSIDEIFPLRARDIVLMGRYGVLGPLEWPKTHDHELVDQKLEQAGIANLADRRYSELSGGQKQRVLIARALAAEAQVLAFDEPTTGMDLEGEQAIMQLIRSLRADSGVTVMFVSHMLNLIANAADRLMLLHEGQVRIGRVEEILTPQVLREVYGLDVIVDHVGTKRVIVP
jgi:ABC-type cobalamin/Fe3+-siderophores transport system ATPase subunit